MTTLVFDEGPGAGLGHRRRMEALALELHVLGHSCRLIPIDRIERVESPIVVVDSYRVRADELAVECRTLVAVDDLARDLAVDLVVDPSPGADAGCHTRARQVFAGAQYALVARPAPRGPVVRATADVDRVLVTTGATDAAGVGARIAASIRAVLRESEIRLVVGAWGAPEVPDGVTVAVAPANLADELASAGIVVTAGGITMLEACLLGRVIVAVVVAENQRVAVEALAAAGAVVATTIDAAAAVVAELTGDSVRRGRLADAARHAVDGLGARRIAEELTS